MNVGELLRERDRLLSVIEEAKSARAKLKQVNIMIAMYGDAEHVELVSVGNGKTLPAELTCDECDAGPFVGSRGLNTHKRTMHAERGGEVTCPECDAGPFKGRAGLNMHNQRVHLGTVKTNGQKAKASK